MALITGDALEVSSAGGGGSVETALPIFLGQSQIFGDAQKGYIECYSSGILRFQQEMVVDLFLVGGGSSGNGYSSGGSYGTYGGGGGAGGDVLTQKAVLLEKNAEYPIVIGAGGAAITGTAMGNAGGTTSFNETFSAAGGLVATAAKNGNPGTSGGGAGGRPGYYGYYSAAKGNNGGSDGSDGVSGADSSYPATGGTGKGVTTREFMEGQGRLFAAGGGGGGGRGENSDDQNIYAPGGAGGAGGGGVGAGSGTAIPTPAGSGMPNTGSGGGGGQPNAYSGAGGAGIVIVRWGFVPNTSIGSLTPGEEVELLENGVLTSFVVLSQGYPAATGTLLIRKEIIAQMAWSANSSGYYQNSAVDVYCESTYPALLDASVQAALLEAPLLTQMPSGFTTLKRKGFLLSGKEAGLSHSYLNTNEGTAISYLAAAAANRIANFEGAADAWWLRSYYTNSASNTWTINTAGNLENEAYTNTVVGVRPCIVLPQNVHVGEGKILGGGS